MTEQTSIVVPLVSEHEEQVEALRLLMQLLLSAHGKAVPVRVICGDGTIKEIEVGETEEERQEVLAVLRRHLRRIAH